MSRSRMSGTEDGNLALAICRALGRQNVPEERLVSVVGPRPRLVQDRAGHRCGGGAQRQAGFTVRPASRPAVGGSGVWRGDRSAADISSRTPKAACFVEPGQQFARVLDVQGPRSATPPGSDSSTGPPHASPAAMRAGPRRRVDQQRLCPGRFILWCGRTRCSAGAAVRRCGWGARCLRGSPTEQGGLSSWPRKRPGCSTTTTSAPSTSSWA